MNFQFRAFLPLIRRMAACALIAVGASAAAAMAQEAAPPEFDVVYKLKYGETEIGTSHKAFRLHEAGEMIVEQRLEVNALFQLLGVDPYIQVSKAGAEGQGKLIPLEFRYSRDLTQASMIDARFDWNARALRTSDGKVMNLPPELAIHDWGSWFLSFMLSNEYSTPGTRIAIAEVDDVDVFAFERPRPETLDTALGRLETLRFTMRQEGKSDRGWSVWAAPSLDNLPVKLERFRKGTVFSLEISELRWR